MIAFWFPRSVKTEIDDSDTASLVHPKGLTTTFRCMISTMDTLSPYSNSFPYYCNIPWVKTCTWKKKFDVDDDLHAKWQEVHKILVSITKLDLKTSSTEQKLMSGWVYDPRSRFLPLIVIGLLLLYIELNVWTENAEIKRERRIAIACDT